MTSQPLAHTSDENLLAAISHFLGLLAALIVWGTQKDRSRYVRFQSIQAMAFDLLVSIAMLVLVGIILVLVFGLAALGIGDIALLGSQANPTAEPVRTMLALMTALPFLIVCLVLPISGLIFLARVIATIQTAMGKDFRYPWLGRQVERMFPD